MTELHIREADENDLPILVTWCCRLAQHTQEATDDVYLRDLDEDHEDHFEPLLATALSSAEQKLLVAELAGIPVGFIKGELGKPFIPVSAIKQIGELSLCWVEPSARRHGVAQVLADNLETWFRQQGVSYVDVHYLVGNEEAESTWAALGFAPYRVFARKAIGGASN